MWLSKGWAKLRRLVLTEKLRLENSATIETVAASGATKTLSLSELELLDAITAGTVTANKAVVPDANKDISEFRNIGMSGMLTFGVGGAFNSDSGTATAAAGAATLNKMAGVITSEALTTAAGADYILTLTNSGVAAGDMVFAHADNGTNTTEGLAINRVTPGAGQVVIRVRNTHATVALNGTVKIGFIVIKA